MNFITYRSAPTGLRIILLGMMLFFCSSNLYPQDFNYKTLLQKPYSENFRRYESLLGNLTELDSMDALNKLNKIKSFAKDHGDKRLALQMDLLWGRYIREKLNDRYSALKTYSKVASKARKEGLIIIRLQALSGKGFIN